MVGYNLSDSDDIARVNIAASPELMRLGKENDNLFKLQEQIAEANADVVAIKEQLEGLDDHEITTDLAKLIDKSLSRVGVVVVDKEGNVSGAEQLGLTLMPKDFKATRIQGCENFIADLAKAAKNTVKNWSDNIAETYDIIFGGIEKSKDRLEEIRTTLNKRGKFKSGSKEITVSPRNAALLSLQNRFCTDWDKEFAKTLQSVKGISNGYHATVRKNVSNMVKYFGGFEDLPTPAAHARYKLLPQSLLREPFKECRYVNSGMSDDEVEVKTSVRLLGDRMFVESRLRTNIKDLKSEEDIEKWVSDYTSKCFVRLNNDSIRDHSTEIKILSLGFDEILNVLHICDDYLNCLKSLFADSTKSHMSDRDYLNTMRIIGDAKWDRGLKDKVGHGFTSICHSYHKQLVAINKDYSTYLSLVFNAVAQICGDSIKAN